ncbi:MAG: hypothetical protein JO279_03995 [Verrucomicrobia bacterium]|nr:hypothetical protein [Verrucomicrobiota bacterium]
MSWISWLEARVGFLGVPRLMQLVAVLNGLVYLLNSIKPSFVQALRLIPERILHGEVWRLVSYIFIPQVGGSPGSPFSMVFLVVYLWFLVWIGDALEHAWGAFRVTLFYFLGMVGVTIAAFFFGGTGVSAFALNSSLFFAFATLYPDVQIYVLFILPLKVKWLAYFTLAMLLIQLFGGPLSSKLAILVSFLNYFVFFGPAAYANIRDRTATDIRRRKFDKASGEGTLHRCVVCKRTEKDNPDLDFRVSRNGEEYCLDHLPK